MKRTEAIEQLQNCIDLIKQDGQDYLDERDIPLLDMAIKALKEQEISSELQEYAYECGYEHFFHECQNCEHRRIENKADKWIPISEGLPKEHEWVGTKQFGTTISDKVHITFDVNGERFVRTLSLQNGELSNYEKRTMDTLHKGWKMIAWMPLPKPYKGGDS